MKIENYQFNKSSFLSIEKDLSIIIEKILSNERLKKLLYYDTPDALTRPNLTQEESLGLIGKQIKIVPEIVVDPDTETYMLISFDEFTPNATNPEFRDNYIIFDIVSHYNTWQLEDFQLRPYRIAAEIDQMFEKKHLTGIGKLYFAKGRYISLTDELGEVAMAYIAIHGNEDKILALSPEEEEILFGELSE